MMQEHIACHFHVHTVCFHLLFILLSFFFFFFHLCVLCVFFYLTIFHRLAVTLVTEALRQIQSIESDG